MPTVTVYHGSPKKFGQFRMPKTHYRKQLGFGIHGSEDKAFAAKYGRYLYTLEFSYTRMVDASELAEAGTPEFDLAISIQKRTGRSRMAEVFIQKGVAPIGLDGPPPGTTLRLLKQYGFDAVRYNAVVTRGLHRVDDAKSWVVLEPEQVRIVGVEDQGAGVKKEYNPYAFREKGEKIVEWGFIDRFGGLIREPVGNKSSLDHEKLARKMLGMTEHQALTDEGYTRLLVSQWDTGLIQAGVEFYGYDVRPLRAIQRWLDKTEITVEKVEIMAKEYNLEDVVPGGRFYGTPLKAKAWLRAYTPPSDEDVEEEENPMWGFRSGVQVDPPVEWGWMRPNGTTIKGGYGGWHDDLARKKKLGKNWVEAVASGYVKYEIKTNGDLLVEGVKSHQAARNIIKLAERPEVREVALTWVRGSDGATMEYSKNEVGVIIQRLRGVGREENPTRVRNGPYRHDSQARDYGFISPRGKVHSGKDVPDIIGHWDLARKLWKKDAEDVMRAGYIRFAVLRNGESLFDVWGGSTRAIKAGLAVVSRFLKESPMVAGEVNLDIYWNDYGKPLWNKRYGSPEEAVRDIRMLSQLMPAEMRKMIYDPTGRSRDYLEEKYESQERGRENPWLHDEFGIFGWYVQSPDSTRYILVRPKKGEDTHGHLAMSNGWSSSPTENVDQGRIRWGVYNKGTLEVTVSPHYPGWSRRVAELIHKLPEAYGEVNVEVQQKSGKFGWLTFPNHRTAISRLRRGDADNLAEVKWDSTWQDAPDDEGLAKNPAPNPSTTYDVTRFGFLRPGQAPIMKGDLDRGKWNHHRIAQKYGFPGHREAVDAGWVRFEHLHHWRGLPEGVAHYAGYLFRKDQESIKAVADHLRRSGAFDRIVLDTRAQGADLDSREFRSNGEALRYLDSLKENPAPRRPGEKGVRWPFKLLQSGDNFIAEMRDLSRYNVVQLTDGTWQWAPANTSRWSERFETLEGALLDLENEAESHTGRLGGTMKFVIYSPTGTILGTVSAPNRRAARDKLRGSVQALKLKTVQDAFLHPYISSSPEARYVADIGVQVR